MRLNPLGRFSASNARSTSKKEKDMPHVATAPGVSIKARTIPLAGVILVVLALCLTAHPARGADPAPKAAGDTTVTIKAFPPAVQVDTASEDSDSEATTARKSSGFRLDSDEDFEAVTERMPWIIGLIFLVVGSIFLTPIVLLVGIIWYKLRKARLQNEAMLALAEKGVVPPAHAAEALAVGAAPASAAPQIYQQALAMRKRVVWSDLRKGVILSMVGLAFSFYWLTESGGPSWLGLVLLFVGVGYVALWWLEGRHLDQTPTGTSNDPGKPGMSGS
jgi:hypothetical protein